MSTQQDIYAAGSKDRHPILNKDKYVPWSCHLLRYAKSKPNGKLIYNSIMHGPYVRRMIHEPGDPGRDVPVAKTFHEQTDDELNDKEVKQMEANDQDIQTILIGLPKDIYAPVDSYETAQCLRVQQIMKGYEIEAQEKKAKLFNEWEMFTLLMGNRLSLTIIVEVNELRAERLVRTHDPLALMENFNNSYNYPVFYPNHPSQITYMQQPLPNNNYIRQPSFNQNYMQQPMINLEDIYDLTTAMNMALVLMAKAFKLNYSTPTNNQRISSNPRNRQIAQPVQNVENQVVQNGVQNLGVLNVENHNGLIVVPGIANQNVNPVGNGNVVAAWNEGNDSTADCQKEGVEIQLQAEEFDLMAAAGDIDEIEEVNAKSDESLAKYKDLEYEFERLLRAFVSLDIMSIVQKPTVVETSDHQTELDPYNDMQQKIAQLQAQLGDLKGKNEDTSCISDTLDPLSQKLENENVELEFQVLNYVKENECNTPKNVS
nr:hypothetical protein [Tanacetum cinerariifolium]